MTARAFSFDPLDTLMFRDGRPFNQGDEGASAAESLFPPPPPTLVGALRLAIAQQNGYPPAWPVALLGDGVNWQADTTQLGPLRFSAPLLLRADHQGRSEPLFPAPLHLAQATQNSSDVLTLLLPRAQYETDLGHVFLVSAPPGHLGVRPLEGDFLTMAGMQALINGKLPDMSAIVRRDTLWQAESRVGIGRDSDKRVAKDGEFYVASHTRLADHVRMVLAVEGLDDKCRFDAANQRLGGEHRTAHLADCAVPQLPQAPDGLASHQGRFFYAAMAIAPVFFDDLPGPGANVPGLSGTLQSACFGKPQMLGGWDSGQGKKRQGKPLPMRPVLPAGSVFFMETDDRDKALACHGTGIGRATEWGFGQVMIARWEAK
ncbi:MAG: type III-B CRISPR module-associated Cmr3 family protein [Rhizobiaceae bacterium]|nr:type III-B CRISPR module-associated Cmr3 family protein [Rhizobiaceae bacterium]